MAPCGHFGILPFSARHKRNLFSFRLEIEEDGQQSVDSLTIRFHPPLYNLLEVLNHFRSDHLGINIRHIVFVKNKEEEQNTVRGGGPLSSLLCFHPHSFVERSRRLWFHEKKIFCNKRGEKPAGIARRLIVTYHLLLVYIFYNLKKKEEGKKKKGYDETILFARGCRDVTNG